VAALAFIMCAWFIPLRTFNNYAYPACFFIIACLALVLLLGQHGGGAQRWLGVGPLRFQPSEFAKLVLVFTVAKFFYLQRSIPVFTLSHLKSLLAITLTVFLLIFKQPDFGTAGTCLMIVVAQMAFVRVRIGWRLLVGMGILVVGSAVAGWHFFLYDYQKLRILNLFDQNLDPSGSGYNALQSLIAVGSGKQFGKGFLQGTQTQLQFLPARHTDFIFSVFAEEHGFWVCCLVFLLFGAISLIALEIARGAKDVFCSLVAIGIGAFTFIEFAINVAMVLGIFPVVGMPLPFFSFGGTALLSSCAGLGVLAAIARESGQGQRRRM
jgi:rod shape determining protein RodA